MITNPIIEAMLRRKSIRRYTDEPPSDEVITAIVQAGQQAPFASQLYSLLLSRHGERNPFGAPLLFTVCVDLHKLALFMTRRDWQVATNDLSLLLFGIQDASLMAENMVIAAESLGLGSCFLGGAPYQAATISQEYSLPPRVFPLVQLAMGYPAEDPPPRPRYPVELVLFENEYPELGEEIISAAMSEMDEGYLAQDYYRTANYMVPLEGDREETFTFDTYSWTEHISRKWGQWYPLPEDLVEQFEKCGFDLGSSEKGTAGHGGQQER
jgi:FMN reductase (NADPH)